MEQEEIPAMEEAQDNLYITLHILYLEITL